MAQPQMFTIGVQGGVPAQTPLGSSAKQMPFLLGPTVDVRINSRFAIETGVMFHRLGKESTTGVFLYPENSFTLTSSAVKARAIEIPMLGKFYVLGGRRTWRPFLVAGPTIRRTSADSSYFASIFSGSQLIGTPSPGVNRPVVDWHVDPAVGGGVDVRTGRFHLSPEVRYSYWGAGTTLPVRKNQVNFLMGFRF